MTAALLLVVHDALLVVIASVKNKSEKMSHNFCRYQKKRYLCNAFGNCPVV